MRPLRAVPLAVMLPIDQMETLHSTLKDNVYRQGETFQGGRRGPLGVQG